MTARKPNPRRRTTGVALTAEDRAALSRVIQAHGQVGASRLLRAGPQTIDAAMDPGGRLTTATVERLRAALEDWR